MSQTKKLGQKAENLANKYLKNKGYIFIAQNFHSPFGEIDLIFQDKDQLVFVEVKARHDTRFGNPEEAINHQKLQKITTTAQMFMQSHPDLPQSARIDAVAVDASETPPKIRHHQNISIS